MVALPRQEMVVLVSACEWVVQEYFHNHDVGEEWDSSSARRGSDHPGLGLSRGKG